MHPRLYEKYHALGYGKPLSELGRSDDLAIAGLPRMRFDEIRLQSSLIEQVKRICTEAQATGESLFGLKVVACDSLPENGFVLLSDGKVVYAGVFKNLPDDIIE